MKKILTTIICFFICIIDVSAETNNPFWSDEIINDNNIQLINQETRYKWYKEEMVYSDSYYTIGSNPEEYPNIVEDDFIKGEFSEWQEEWYPKTLGREIESKVAYKYHIIRPIRYIFIKNVSESDFTFNVSELNILIDDSIVDYIFECSNCSTNFNNEINDGNIDQNDVYINNGGILRIDLGDYYRINQVKLRLYTYNSASRVRKCDIYMNEGDTLEDRNYARWYINSHNNSTPLENLLYAGYGWLTNPVYEDWTYVDEQPKVAYYNQYSNVYLSRYRDLQYKFYKIGRNYLDDYYLNIDDGNYIKDEGQPKEYYLYAYNIESLENTEDNDEDTTTDNTQNDNDEQTEIENNNDDSSDEEGINENDTIEYLNDNQDNVNTELEETNKEVINEEKIVADKINNNTQTKKKIYSSNNYVAINIDNQNDKIEENKLDQEQNIINTSPIYKIKYIYNKYWYMLVVIIVIETLTIIILILLKRKNRKCVV
jgi:hypothetical protein